MEIRKHIPNLCSLTSLALGFASLDALLSGHPEWAVRHLLMALLLDLAAGRLALALKARSAMGLELDQITGLATQGVLPMVLLWSLGLKGLGAWGLAVVAIGAAGAAFRLSRHNPETPETAEYRGLPLSVFGLASTLMAWAVMARLATPALAVLAVLALSLLLNNSWGYLRMPQGPVFPLLTALLLALAAVGTPQAGGLLLALAGLYAAFGHLPFLKKVGFLKPEASGEEKLA
jgi:CDP-diacylglycerol--serine O-phosphatidyltransferase